MYRGLAFVLFCAVLLFINSAQVFAQTTTAEELYTAARAAAFDDKDYVKSISLAKQALDKAPAYTDIVVFIGRLYSWSKQPDSARAYFSRAINQQPDQEDAYAAYADLEYWNNNDEQGLAIVDAGLTRHPASVNLLLRKARVLNKTRDYKAAFNVVDTILSIDKSNTEARALASQIRDNVSKNRIGVKYDYVHFDKQFPDPWQFLSLDYTRQTKYGAITARMNYANRFKTDGVQYELEAYPRFSKTFYAYVNAGYSDNVGVFPKWKAGASLYANLPKAFETEVGIRYLYFTTDAFIYTIYAGKYYKKFLFGARTYLSPAASNIAQSYSIMGRYYYGGIEDYVGVNLGAGLSPDDRRVNVQLNSIYKLRTYTGEVVWRHAIKKLNIITVNASILNQEYLPKTIGNQLQVGIGYIRRF